MLLSDAKQAWRLSGANPHTDPTTPEGEKYWNVTTAAGTSWNMTSSQTASPEDRYAASPIQRAKLDWEYNMALAEEQIRSAQMLDENIAISKYNQSLNKQAEVNSFFYGLRSEQTLRAGEQGISEIARKSIGERAKIVNAAGAAGALGNTLNRILFTSGYSQEQAQSVLKENTAASIAQNYLQDMAGSWNAEMGQKAYRTQAPGLAGLRLQSIINKNEAEWTNNPAVATKQY